MGLGSGEFEYQLTLASNRYQQKVVDRCHGVVSSGGCGCTLELPNQPSGDQLQFHHCKILSYTCSRPFGERYKQLFHLIRNALHLQPPLWLEGFRVWEDIGVPMSCIALHRSDCLVMLA